MMIFLFIIVLGISVILGVYYLTQFYSDLDGKKENIIKDGLIKELIVKAVADPDPNSFIINTNRGIIKMGRISIYSNDSELFWFPYKVYKQSKDFSERNHEDDWGGIVGYVRLFSKDYQHIKALLKENKVNIELIQREKLNLNK
jgi:hypothetical protein